MVVNFTPTGEIHTITEVILPLVMVWVMVWVMVMEDTHIAAIIDHSAGVHIMVMEDSMTIGVTEVTEVAIMEVIMVVTALIILLIIRNNLLLMAEEKDQVLFPRDGIVMFQVVFHQEETQIFLAEDKRI
jgi:hypothetical protein